MYGGRTSWACFQAPAAKELRNAHFWVITQRVGVISYRRFGTTSMPSSGLRSYFLPTFRDNLSSPSSRLGSYFLPTFRNNLSVPFHQRMAPISCPETLLRYCHYSLCNNPENHSSQRRLVLTSLLVQGVPPPTKPGSSLIILPLMRILQRNLKRTYLIV